MSRKTDFPAIYWVVGEATNTGKTTIASALIKTLNARDVRAVGFKPYASSRLYALVDFMIETYPRSQAKLFGKDAWELTMASPLTGPDLVDLVVPCQLLSHPTWRQIVLMRTGSAQLNNVEYICTEYGAGLKNRADFQRLIKKTRLPFDVAVLKTDIDVLHAHRVAPEKQRLAFNSLLDIGVDAVVCEGAGEWLPIWQDCPMVNHVFLLSGGLVRFFPNVDLSFVFQAERAVRRVDELVAILNEANSHGFAIPLYLVEQNRRDEVVRQVVSDLLEGVQQSGQLEDSNQSPF